MKRYKQFRESLRDEIYRKKVRIFFHSTLLLILLLFAIFGYSYSWPIQFSELLFRDVFEYGSVTLFVYLIYGLHLKNIKFSIRALILLIMVSSLIVLAYYKNIDRITPSTHVFDELMSYIGFGLLLFLSFIFIDNIHIFLDRKYNDIQRSLKEAENLLLRQQFNPHFLFNALNSVYSMALNNHPKTADTILTFSGMMRYLSDEVSIHKVPLKYEVDFLHSYINMEKIRFGNDANITFSINDSLDNYMIESLILITLIENAFKHGFYTNDKNSYVHINLQIRKNFLSLTVTNSLKDSHTNQRNGKGLEIFKKRLDLSYKNKYELKCNKENDSYKAILSLDLTE